MGADGAYLGIGAEEAMKAVLGSEEPVKEMDVQEFEQYILSAPDDLGSQTYDTYGRGIAKRMLKWLLAHPEDGQLPLETKYEDLPDGRAYYYEDDKTKWVVKQEGLWERLRANMPAEEFENYLAGASGFQVGWAFNAARRCCELPPKQNPAIVTVGGGDET